MDGRMFDGLVTTLIVVGIIIGVVLVEVIPWLWSLLKPLIHAWTA